MRASLARLADLLIASTAAANGLPLYTARDRLYRQYTEQIPDAVFEPPDLFTRAFTVHSDVKASRVLGQRRDM
jgi:hypothetical protein